MSEHGPDPVPTPVCAALLYLSSLTQQRFCLTVNKTVFSAAIVLLCDRPYMLPELLVVSLNVY